MAVPGGAYDASDDEQFQRRKTREGRQTKSDADVLRKIMHDPKGRDWLYRLLERCHIYQTSFTPAQPDVTAFREGERNIGNTILLDALAASPDLYLKMMKEQNERVAAEAREAQSRETKDD